MIFFESFIMHQIVRWGCILHKSQLRYVMLLPISVGLQSLSYEYVKYIKHGLSIILVEMIMIGNAQSNVRCFWCRTWVLWQIKTLRCHILSNEKCVMKAGFVSFNSRWGAAVCAQTQQSKDSTCWLTDWAPEARDVRWDNLSIPYMELNSRRLLVGFIIFFIASFFMIPITFVQSLANLDSLDKNFHFLKPLIDQ